MLPFISMGVVLSIFSSHNIFIFDVAEQIYINEGNWPLPTGQEAMPTHNHSDSTSARYNPENPCTSSKTQSSRRLWIVSRHPRRINQTIFAHPYETNMNHVNWGQTRWLYERATQTCLGTVTRLFSAALKPHAAGASKYEQSFRIRSLQKECTFLEPFQVRHASQHRLYIYSRAWSWQELTPTGYAEIRRFMRLFLFSICQDKHTQNIKDDRIPGDASRQPWWKILLISAHPCEMKGALWCHIRSSYPPGTSAPASVADILHGVLCASDLPSRLACIILDIKIKIMQAIIFIFILISSKRKSRRTKSMM